MRWPSQRASPPWPSSQLRSSRSSRSRPSSASASSTSSPSFRSPCSSGSAYALPVSVASMLAFNWFFLPPRHTFRLTDSENWVALAVYLVTAVVVSGLAARSRSREAEAERKAREAALLAEVAGALLESSHVQEELRGIAGRVAHALGARRGRIELDSVRRPERDESAYELRAGERSVGQVFLEEEPDADVAETPASRRSRHCSPSRSTANDSGDELSRPRRCAGATRSRPRSSVRSVTTCARR